VLLHRLHTSRIVSVFVFLHRLYACRILTVAVGCHTVSASLCWDQGLHKMPQMIAIELIGAGCFVDATMSLASTHPNSRALALSFSGTVDPFSLLEIVLSQII
jgi:hypothetical protein